MKKAICALFLLCCSSDPGGINKPESMQVKLEPVYNPNFSCPYIDNITFPVDQPKFDYYILVYPFHLSHCKGFSSWSEEESIFNLDCGDWYFLCTYSGLYGECFMSSPQCTYHLVEVETFWSGGK